MFTAFTFGAVLSVKWRTMEFLIHLFILWFKQSSGLSSKLLFFCLSKRTRTIRSKKKSCTEAENALKQKMGKIDCGLPYDWITFCEVNYLKHFWTLMLFLFFLKTCSCRKILSSAISLYSFFKPAVPVDRHLYTGGAVFVGGKTATIYRKPCFHTDNNWVTLRYKQARICVAEFKVAGEKRGKIPNWADHCSVLYLIGRENCSFARIGQL